MTREYLSYDHLVDVVTSEAGSIKVQPLRADDIHFDVAHSNHLPANLPESRNGSTVLDIGRGVQVRAIGNAKREDNVWTLSHLSVSRYPGGNITPDMQERARTIITAMIAEWAGMHEDKIAQADKIDRNNAARTLEENIERHEDALSILREELSACDDGDPFTQYPALPTDRR